VRKCCSHLAYFGRIVGNSETIPVPRGTASDSPVPHWRFVAGEPVFWACVTCRGSW
jgi:hypothetical protein